MTNEEWKEVEDLLNGQWCPVNLLIDGYKVSYVLTRVGMTLKIMTYVDGEWRGAWHDECEESKRFACPKKIGLGRKYKAALKKIGKRYLKERNIDLDKTKTMYSPFWTSFKRLKAHLIKNNKSIELIKEGTNANI